ncbi:DNA ligase D [Bacillus sp. RG28]|uniref:DNA ligase D n=1 Tax=Gottfriedia endophytica TaxID=2820819 RepID=A0A940SKZ2_9BACI|nr:DNA ligase D [Gottfriedia endophytica]MBP0726529.1 DNA ligase D [Gottfriedia endophytica]
MDYPINNIFSKKRSKYSGSFFLIGFSTHDQTFQIGIIKERKIVRIGSFKKGLKQNEKEILTKTVVDNQNGKENEIIMVDPSICVEIAFQSVENEQLINPIFKSFLLQQDWEQCTWDRLILNNVPIDNEIKITHPEKIIWNDPSVNKENFLAYLAQISPFILPFLEKRLLTTIRYPKGITGESFFQKNCPDYAPKFIKTVENDGIKYIICNDLSTLIWLGNQLAIEFHIPFQTVDSNYPIEIVFDLDPPCKEAFPLAIKAAKEMRKIFDSFNLISYPKLSGSKGLQIHIPIKRNTLTYNETRLFTSFIADYLVEKFPDDFTIERLKKNRGGRLYLDYVQHGEGKTIICPYSTRGKELPTVATPLYWDEITDQLKFENYIIPMVLNRLSSGNCPMNDYFEQENPSLYDIINALKENKNKF